MKHSIEIKILPETYQLLRLVAALTREPQHRVLHRLLSAEAEKVLKEQREQYLRVGLPPAEEQAGKRRRRRTEHEGTPAH